MNKTIIVAMSIVLGGIIVFTTPNDLLAFAQSNDIRIDGAGATFAFPLIDLWRVAYQDVKPDITLNYQSIGSGGGVKAHIEKTVQFGATEAPLTDAEAAVVPGTLTIPNMIGAVSLVYNVPGISGGLDLTTEALCGIFLGDITVWNDPAIANYNTGIELPADTIVTVHRSDGSGTTFAFTSYLTKTCPEWDRRVGAAKSVQWPTGLGSPGNEGVAGTIRTTDNAIGYVTLAYAIQNDMQTANIQNGDKTAFVYPSIETASSASGNAAFWLPKANESWREVDLLAAPGTNSYPITSFSYMIMHPELDDVADSREQAQAIVDFAAWTITEGQQYNSGLQYVPIDDLVRNIGLAGLAQVTYDGEQLYTGPTNVWENGIESVTIADAVETIRSMLDERIIDQSTFLNLMAQLAQLHGAYAAELINDDELANAIDNILS